VKSVYKEPGETANCEHGGAAVRIVGYLGEVEVDRGFFMIRKWDPWDARAVRGRTMTVRLDRIREVYLGYPTRTEPGWLQIVTDDDPRPMTIRRAAATDPYTVLFPLAGEPTFIQLGEWLRYVIAHRETAPSRLLSRPDSHRVIVLSDRRVGIPPDPRPRELVSTTSQPRGGGGRHRRPSASRRRWGVLPALFPKTG
jgi:hypothetical protein